MYNKTSFDAFTIIHVFEYYFVQPTGLVDVGGTKVGQQQFALEVKDLKLFCQCRNTGKQPQRFVF